MEKSCFAVLLGNRGTFPTDLILQARRELTERLEKAGHRVLMMPPEATGAGAVESPEEGRVFARFFKAHREQIDGVILSLPNFGSEGGVIAALQDVNVPVWVHAYPDQLNQMATATRRDAFCGKFAVLNILRQYGVPFSNPEPHTAMPGSAAFAKNLAHFNSVCRAVAAMRGMTVGAIGARTTPFKAVRYDEIAMQKHGVTVETLDLSDVFMRFEKLDAADGRVAQKHDVLAGYVGWDQVPEEAFNKLCRLGVVLDDIIDEYALDALALRCWAEIQQHLGVSPCVLVSEMNDRGRACACEVDVCSAVTMAILQAAAGSRVATNLDWNNNYGDEADKCILFHCGPVPQSLMAAKGTVVDHDLLVPAVGPGCSWGCNVGRIKPMDMTFAGLLTRDGQLHFYVGEGQITNDLIPDEFFGCAGVAQVSGLQRVLHQIGNEGHRHHTVLVEGHVAAAVSEALTVYGQSVVMRVTDS